MLLNPTPDQSLFRETTATFLDELVPVDVLRDLRHEPTGEPPKYWQRGAELGWTILLVDEQHGGGAVSEHGLIDLTLVAHEFGRHAAPGPLMPTNVVAAALSRSRRRGHGRRRGSARRRHVDRDVVPGRAAAARPPRRMAYSTCASTATSVVLNGMKRPVEPADQAELLLVTGRTGDGLTQVLVPSDTPGVSIGR